MRPEAPSGVKSEAKPAEINQHHLTIPATKFARSFRTSWSAQPRMAAMSFRAPGVKVLQMEMMRGRMFRPIGSGWRGISAIRSRRGLGMEAGYWGRREEEGTPQGAGRGVRILEMASVKSLGERAVSNVMGVGGVGFGGCGAVVGVGVDGVMFWG